MRLRVGFFASIFFCFSSSVWAQSAASVKDGIFTQVQADKGKGVILDWCAKCHSANLLGGENNTPALIGAEFLDKWRNHTIAELFDKMRTTMPVDDPGKLSRTDYVSALAYILSVNNFPAGMKPLSGDMKALGQITITP